MFRLQLNNATFNGLTDRTIFQSAQEHAVLIEHSCLSGRCSSCKAKVISGCSEATVGELGLTEEEKNENYILTCVRRPTSDMVLDLDVISGVQFEKSRTLPAKIHSVSMVVDDVVKLVLRFPPNSNFKFLAGQYVNIIRGAVKRSYSIGGIDPLGMLIFYIKKYQNGEMSNYLFNESKQNDLVRIEGPLGTFFLRENSLENLVFLATGTGIAPILSILLDAKNKDILNTRNIYLFHGGRLESDLLEKDMLKDLDIFYFPTLSREKKENFNQGYIQQILMNQNLDLGKTSVYACGSTNMIEDAKTLLLSNGLPLNQFYSDAFLESN